MLEKLSEALLEDLLEDGARAAWAVEADRQLEGMAERRLQAPTLESMLLRMEEIQVSIGCPSIEAPAAEGQSTNPKRSQTTGAVIYSEQS